MQSEKRFSSSLMSGGLVLSSLAIGGLMAAASANASTVVVTPTNMSGWAFNSTDSNSNLNTGNPDYIGALVTGPATPPLGTGSAELEITNGAGDGSEQLRNTGYNGVALSSITSLSYSTYDVTNNGQQFPYLKLYISTTGSGPANDALYFEPPYQTPSTGNPSLPNQGGTTLNQWQSWNALTGGWWDDNGIFNPGTTEGSASGVDSIADYLAMFPNATIVNDGTLGGVRFAVGFSEPGDDYQGYVDDFTVGVNGVNTTYDFEPASVPEPTSLSLLALGSVGLLRVGGDVVPDGPSPGCDA